MKKSIIALFITAVLGLTAAHAQDLTVEQIVEKHLDSIGSKQKRAELKNSVVQASVGFSAKGSSQRSTGKAVLVGAGEKNLWGMMFQSNDYPQDKFGYDGEQVAAAFIRPGVYSTLGGYLRSYKEVLKNGLLGGTLFSSWTLMHLDVNKPKLSYGGRKKAGDIEAYVIDYGVKGGSELTIKLYFDTKNFRHIRTEYTNTIAARQGSTIDNSAGQSPDRYKVVEDFSDFQAVGGITIPKKYKLSYSFSGSASLRFSQNSYKELEWNFEILNFVTNQDLDPATFVVS